MAKEVEKTLRMRLETAIKEAKDDAKKERERLEEKLKTTMVEKSELEANFSFL